MPLLQLFILAMLLVGLAEYAWFILPALLLITIGIIAYSVSVTPGGKRKRRRRTYAGSQRPTVAYLIEKDGYGKFGITYKNGAPTPAHAVYKRYYNEPLRIHWTKVLPTRDEALRFEEFCKTRVPVIKGREWFPVSYVPTLLSTLLRTY